MDLSVHFFHSVTKIEENILPYHPFSPLIFETHEKMRTFVASITHLIIKHLYLTLKRHETN